MATNLVIYNNTNLVAYGLSPISISQVKIEESWLLLNVLGEDLSLAPSSFWWPLSFLGLWPQHANLYSSLCWPLLFCSLISLSLFLVGIFGIILYLGSTQIIQGNLLILRSFMYSHL